MSKARQKKAQKRANSKNASVVFPQTEERFTVAIIGAGASGIAAACMIARYSYVSRRDVRVVLLEKMRRIGSSILRSGNGRCNFSHATIDPCVYWHSKTVEQVLDSLEAAWSSLVVSSQEVILDDLIASYTPQVSTNAVLRWFADLGLAWSEAGASEGLLYPYSNKSSSVLEVLQAELDRHGVEYYCSIEASALSCGDKSQDRFEFGLVDASTRSDLPLSTENKVRSFQADRIIFASGGKSIPVLQNLEPFACLDIPSLVPVLGPLKTQTHLLEGLDGIRAQVRLSCPSRSFAEEGEILFRSYGVSGIVAFNASRFVRPGDVITIDLAPSWSFEQLEEMLLHRLDLLVSKKGKPIDYCELLKGFLLPELARAVLRFSSLDEFGNSRDRIDGGEEARGIESKEAVFLLVRALKSFDLFITGYGDPQQCQVIRGGVPVDALDLETMESKMNPGIFFTGELLDVDGPCGGYNLHWAWASGMLAGISVVKELLDHRETVHAEIQRAEGGLA